MFARTILVLMFLLAAAAAPITEAAEQSIADTIKKIFATPTPPPRKKTSATRKKKSPTPTPTPSAKSKMSPSPTPSPTATPKKKRSPTPTPSPRRKKKISPTPTPSETPAGAVPPTPTTTPTPLPPAFTPSPPQQPSATETPKRRGAPNATLTPDAIKGFENYPPKVQQLLTSALELTTRDLTYTYGSADPANGGMDCSGFVYYVLNKNGVTDVPRNSSEQYVWLRRAGKFEPVLSRKDDSFELENLQPGDLLFWTGTYAIERDPPITHGMIYVGREKKTGKRVMVGSSDGRVYQGEPRNGVSVFDFKIQRPTKSENGKLQPTFIGYGHIPGVRE